MKSSDIAEKRNGRWATGVRPVSDYAIDRAPDLRIAQLRLGAEKLSFCGRELAAGSLKCLLSANPAQIVQLLLRLLILAARLRESYFSSVEFTPRKRALLKKFFAAVHDFLLRFSGSF